MVTDEYRTELIEIDRRLRQAGFQSSIRALDSAPFVYVEHHRRPAEISKNVGGWFIELFEEPNEVSIRDEMQDTIHIAVEQVVDWLRNQ